MARTRTSAKTIAAIRKGAARAGGEDAPRAAGAKTTTRRRGKAAASGVAKVAPGRRVPAARARQGRTTEAPALAQPKVAASAGVEAAESVVGIRPRAGSRIAAVIDMLRDGRGATIGELVAATGWLAHTMRAALTGLRRKGLVIERTRDGEGASRYRIVDAAPSERSA